MATLANLYIDAGTDYSTTVNISLDGISILNLTGYTVKSQMRKSYSSSKVFDFTAVVSNAGAGRITIAMNSTETSLIPAGRWLYDIEITSPSNKRSRVVEGIVIVTPQITQT